MIRGEPPASLRDFQQRVLVLVAGKREREVTLEVLASSGLSPVACSDVEDLVRSMSQGAMVALVAEELLSAQAVGRIASWLRDQPAWSDFPIIVFSGAERKALRENSPLANVTFLERPVRLRSMLASIRNAIRSRTRQYEARHAIESRDNFLAMLGHELRNPLSAISLASTLMARRAEQRPRPKELDVIARQSEHLARLVDDLLDVARITHGKVSLTKAPLRVADVARSSFETLQHRAAEHLSAYELRVLAPELSVEGDRQRLEQVLSNLLTNAIKYTPQGGRVELVVRTEPGVAVMEVTDSGIGLAPTMLNRVFEPFAQVDASLDRAQGGIGLGLSLVQSIVQMHGGSVSALSPGLGRGATFAVRLPTLAA
ncbi:MAG: HAMP domain-containing histidine kinase [Myxococcales bacterium]|nr:MAG: HAMP domain-containing histidine kinase [Myxococcales bacterium]